MIEAMASDGRLRIIMVCLGNTCRSPSAEVVLRHKLREAGLHHVEVDSAGTGNWHEGDGPDPRAQATWERRGYEGRHIARQFRTEWFDERDLILVMDDSNYETLQLWARTVEQRARLRFLREFDADLRGTDPSRTALFEVPDPYYGGLQGFEDMLDLIERACDGLIEALQR